MASSKTSIADAVLDICWTIREAMTSKFLRSKVAPENEVFKNYARRFPNIQFRPPNRVKMLNTLHAFLLKIKILAFRRCP